MKPQKIKIIENQDEESGFHRKKNFCPFQLVWQYFIARGGYDDIEEQFFIFRDGSPVKAEQARAVLKKAIINLGLDHKLYGFHSFRIGRTTDLIKFKYDLDLVHHMG